MKIPSTKDISCTSETISKEEVPNSVSDFSEYMWMENEEEFDEEVMKQLEEEALMEQCIEAMLEDELENKENMVAGFSRMGLEEKADLAKKSTLNPDAAEFVPRFSMTECSSVKKEDGKSASSTKETTLDTDERKITASKENGFAGSEISSISKEDSLPAAKTNGSVKSSESPEQKDSTVAAEEKS